VPSLLPVLLFRLEKEKDASLSHAVLYSLPKLGTHKSSVMRRITMALRLGALASICSTCSTWGTQSWSGQWARRTLFRVLGPPGGKLGAVAGRDAQWEMLLARAACLKGICKERTLGPTLSCDSRPPVVEAVAELLALVPQLTAKSPEYE
ncbi:hypothetical protein CRUP_026927, partial [Coryphaenoides rupestris]